MVDYFSSTVLFNIPGFQHRWQADLAKAYPLPTAPADKCRDAFLKELLAPYEPSSEESTADAEADERHKQLEDELSDSNLDSQLIHRMTLQRISQARRTDQSITEQRISLITPPDIFQLMKGRFGRVTSAVGFLFTLMELTGVTESLKLIYDSCELNVSKDNCFNIFSWSTEHYFTRFNMPNPTYLDVVKRDLNVHMNWYKFRVDLTEIMRLFGAIDDDLRHNREICENSMFVIKDAEIDIKELVSTYLKMAEEEHRNVALSAIGFAGRSADPGNLRKISVQSRINHVDFVFPIEARYRFKWAKAQTDQNTTIREKRFEQVRHELNEVMRQTKESEHFWHCTRVAYHVQSNALKARLMEIETIYEMNMEILTNEQKLIQNKLADAKETLENNRARVEMFHDRIDEMLQFFVQQKSESEANIQELPTKESRHRSTNKSLRRSKKKSVGDKKTAKKKKKKSVGQK